MGINQYMRSVMTSFQSLHQNEVSNDVISTHNVIYLSIIYLFIPKCDTVLRTASLPSPALLLFFRSINLTQRPEELCQVGQCGASLGTLTRWPSYSPSSPLCTPQHARRTRRICLPSSRRSLLTTAALGTSVLAMARQPSV